MPDLSQLPTWAHAVIVVLTILVIAKGAHLVVEGAAKLAQRLGISELVIGLTVVAIGTSAPEFAVTLLSAFDGKGDISVGNIVGSNIFNLGFILGGAALARAIPTTPTLVYRDGAVLLGGTVLLGLLVGFDLELGHLDGAIMAAALITYLLWLFRKRDGGDAAEEVESLLSEPSGGVGRDVLHLVGGLIAILAGSHLMVDSATQVARAFGLSEWVIGVTIVAAGTSAPELATTLTGIMKGRYQMSAGGVIGSDVFNVFGVLGLAGLVRPVVIEASARGSLFALSGMVLIALAFMRTGWKVSRLEGGLLVAIGVGRWVLDFASRAGP
jgi:cation:H+ antiporter